MKKHSWPGNVRELENVLMRAIVLDEWDFEKLFLPGESVDLISDEDILPLADYERDYIVKVYNALDRNKTKTATALKISLNTLKNKLK